MARGPKKHLKRLAAPKHWMLSKLGGIFVSIISNVDLSRKLTLYNILINVI